MSEKKELNQEQLEKVSGGDNGDVESERALTPEGVRPRYAVGQEVEVYNTSAHFRTKRSKIEKITIKYGNLGNVSGWTTVYSDHYWPLYTVYVYEDKVYRDVSSEEIES